MRQLHKPTLFSWSEFNTEKNIDFNGYLWTRDGGNVLIDPVPMSPHDQQHLMSLGGAAVIILSNSDHVRDTQAIAKRTGAEVWGPAEEKKSEFYPCDRWLKNGETPLEGLEVLTLNGSKTPGELALVLEGDTLVVGDLVRSHEAGCLRILPPAKLSNREEAIASVLSLGKLKGIQAVLTGDGWPVFRDGEGALEQLLATLT